MRYFLAIFVFVIILLPLSVRAQTQVHGCLEQCLSQGGLPERCNEKCGITTHGSVNYPAQGTSLDKPLRNQIGDSLDQQLGEDSTNSEGKKPSQAFEECYAEYCRGDNMPLEECIKNCTKLTVLEGNEKTNLTPAIKMENVDGKQTYDGCIKWCAAEGEDSSSCRAICSDYK